MTPEEYAQQALYAYRKLTGRMPVDQDVMAECIAEVIRKAQLDAACAVTAPMVTAERPEPPEEEHD